MPKTPLASGRKLKMPKLDLKPALTAAMERLKTALQERLQEQGHRLTGSLEKSLQYEVKPAPDGYTAVMTSAEYGVKSCFSSFGVSSVFALLTFNSAVCSSCSFFLENIHPGLS